MTVLQVCAYAAPYEGNFIKSLKELGKALKEKGINMIYAFPETCKEIEWCQNLEKETNVYYLPLAKARIRLETYNDFKEIFRKHRDISVIHSHFELYDVPVTVTAPKGVKVFWHLHDAIQEYTSLKCRVANKIQYGIMHKNAVLLSVSEKHKDYAIRLGFPKERTYFVPNGLNLERIKLVEPGEKYYDFLMFGWEIERKGVDLAIEASKQIDREFRVGIVGSEETKAEIKERYGILEKIEVVGMVEDINELYQKSNCFLHISRAEGLSYALLESIYSGLSVISSDIDENAFAENFPTVAMTKNEDIKSIARAMNNQLDNPRHSKDEVDKSREMIEKDYSISSWVENILGYYGVD